MPHSVVRRRSALLFTSVTSLVTVMGACGLGDPPPKRVAEAYTMQLGDDRRAETRYLLHVSEADVEALNLEEPSVPDRHGFITLTTGREVFETSRPSYCLKSDAVVTEDDVELVTVPENTCFRQGSVKAIRLPS